jgi:hypothetical protein
MKRIHLSIIGFCGSLLVMPAGVADDAAAQGGERGAPTSASATESETGSVAGGAGSGARSSGAGKAKRAGTATAAGIVYDQVKKGNVRIHGTTDADIYK